MKSCPVVHFELPAKDKKRVTKFYTETFGWDMLSLGEEMGGYVLANTTEVDQKTQRPKEPGAINGGFFSYDPTKPGFQYPSVVIAVENLDKSMELVKKNGGKIEGEPVDIPGVGLYAAVIDTEGNRVGMLQSSMM